MRRAGIRFYFIFSPSLPLQSDLKNLRGTLLNILEIETHSLSRDCHNGKVIVFQCRGNL